MATIFGLNSWPILSELNSATQSKRDDRNDDDDT